MPSIGTPLSEGTINSRTGQPSGTQTPIAPTAPSTGYRSSRTPGGGSNRYTVQPNGGADPNGFGNRNNVGPQYVNSDPSNPGLPPLATEDLRFASDAVLTDYIQNNYGYFASFMNDPEIKGILFDAARNGWDEGKLYAKMTGTNWWQNTSAAARTWQKLVNEDPAEASRLVNQQAATIQNRARSLGFGLSSGQISGLALTATKNGWTDAQVVDNLIGQVNWATLQGGDLTAARDSVAALGSDYLVGVSDSTSQGYAERIASGELSMDGVRSIMLKQAKARFGWMAEELDQGITVKDYFRPVQDQIARELEMAPEAVDMMDSKWLSMLEVKDEETGKMRGATLNEAMLSARRQPEWANTNKSQESTANISSMIANIFGRNGS